MVPRCQNQRVFDISSSTMHGRGFSDETVTTIASNDVRVLKGDQHGLDDITSMRLTTYSPPLPAGSDHRDAANPAVCKEYEFGNDYLSLLQRSFAPPYEYSDDFPQPSVSDDTLSIKKPSFTSRCAQTFAESSEEVQNEVPSKNTFSLPSLKSRSPSGTQDLPDSVLKFVLRLTDTPPNDSLNPKNVAFSPNTIPEPKIVVRNCSHLGLFGTSNSTRDDDNEDAFSTFDAHRSLASSSESFCIDGSQRSREQSVSTQNMVNTTASSVPDIIVGSCSHSSDAEIKPTFLSIPRSRRTPLEACAGISSRSSDFRTEVSGGVLTLVSTPSCPPGTPTWSLSSEDANGCNEMPRRSQSSHVSSAPYTTQSSGKANQSYNECDIRKEKLLTYFPTLDRLAVPKLFDGWDVAGKAHNCTVQSQFDNTQLPNDLYFSKYQVTSPNNVTSAAPNDSRRTSVMSGGVLRHVNSGPTTYNSDPKRTNPAIESAYSGRQLSTYANGKQSFVIPFIEKVSSRAEHHASGAPSHNSIEPRNNTSNHTEQQGGYDAWGSENGVPYASPVPSLQIPRSLTDFYSLAYASKRWQNLNVVLPLFIPHGIIAVIRSTGENTYVFPDEYPASQLLFSGAGRICDMWSTYLRLRVAVIHKCPEFLVPRVAQAFNDRLADLPRFSSPIRLRCSGMVKHTIQLRSSGGLTYRYDTIGQVCDPEDKKKMRLIFDALEGVLNEVNNNLAKEVEEMMRVIYDSGSVNTGNTSAEDDGQLSGYCTFVHRAGNPVGSSHRDPTVCAEPYGSTEVPYVGSAPPSGANSWSRSKCGLEFRFSPCKELKIAIREGTLCDCAGVDSMITGGGASSMSCWAQQFSVDNLMVGEIRLERDKTSETQLDPFFLPEHDIRTRMISKDLDKRPARVCFVHPSVYPRLYKPPVVYTLNMTPFQAAERLCGATHRPLARMLPNGLASLIPNTPYYASTMSYDFESNDQTYHNNSEATTSVASVNPIPDETHREHTSVLSSSAAGQFMNRTTLAPTPPVDIYGPGLCSSLSVPLASSLNYDSAVKSGRHAQAPTVETGDLPRPVNVTAQRVGSDEGKPPDHVSTDSKDICQPQSTTASGSLAILQKMLSEITIPYSPMLRGLQNVAPLGTTPTTPAVQSSLFNTLEPAHKEWGADFSTLSASTVNPTQLPVDSLRQSLSSLEWLADTEPRPLRDPSVLYSQLESVFHKFPLVPRSGGASSRNSKEQEKEGRHFCTEWSTDDPLTHLQEPRVPTSRDTPQHRGHQKDYSPYQIPDIHPARKCCGGSSPKAPYHRTIVHAPEIEKEQEHGAESDSSPGIHESPRRASKSVGGTPAHHRSSTTSQDFDLVKALITEPANAVLFDRFPCPATSVLDGDKCKHQLKLPAVTTTIGTTTTTEDSLSTEGSSLLPQNLHPDIVRKGITTRYDVQ